MCPGCISGAVWLITGAIPGCGLLVGGAHKFGWRKRFAAIAAKIHGKGEKGMSTVAGHRVVGAKEWVAARTELLKKEKEFTRLRDELSKKRRELPWEKVEKNYVFEGPNGKESLADLFDGHSQLMVYHFMLGPEWAEGCPSCSFLADHFDGAIPHLNARDVTFAVISRAPLSQIQAFQKRMGWKFKWVSSNGTDFNFDYKVSFTPEEIEKGEPNYNFNTIP